MPGEPPLDPQVASRLLADANDPFLLMDLAGTVVWANPAVAVLGWRPEQLVGRSGFELIRPEDVGRATRVLQAIHGGHRPPSSAPFEVACADGGHLECDVAGWVLDDGDDAGGDGAPSAIALHLRPTQDARVLRVLLERLLAGAPTDAVVADMLDLLYHRSHDVAVLVAYADVDGSTRVVGDALDARLAGIGADSGSPWLVARSEGRARLFTVGDLDAERASLAAAAGLRDGMITPVTDGEGHLATITVWVREGGPPADLDTYSVPLIAQLLELVLRWQRQARALEHAASRDPLTGLPNRRALAELDASGPTRPVGVLVIDLDRFKPVNDRLGHAAGDELLQIVATRLLDAAATVGEHVRVVRLGGDEFGVVLPEATVEVLGSLAERILASLAQPVRLQADEVQIGSSIGAAIGDDDATPLLEAADRALYDAKGAGRGTVRWVR